MPCWIVLCENAVLNFHIKQNHRGFLCYIEKAQGLVCTTNVLKTKQYNREVNVTVEMLGFPYFMEKPHRGFCILFLIIFKLLENKEKFSKILSPQNLN